MKSVAWATMVAVVALAVAGCLEQSENAMDIAEDMPGIYDPVSNGKISLLLTDMHRYASTEHNGKSEKDLFTIGFVIRNDNKRSSAPINPDFFRLVDESGRCYSTIPEMNRALKNPLESSELAPGELKWCAVAFEIPPKVSPVMLRLEMPGALTLTVGLNKKPTPPGHLYSVEDIVQFNNWLIAVTGIFESEKSPEKILRIEYNLMNSGSRVASLEDRSYGKFADIIDSRGMFYSARSYEIQNPIIQPGGLISGFMTYTMPEDAIPCYLIFWPPDEEAVTFDLSGCYP